MNRTFVFSEDRRSSCSRFGSTLNRWLWGALCCGVPGVPCYFCTCCEKLDEAERDRPRVNQSTATAERMSRPHRPHAPRGRKSTPEMLSAVRCALSQLQGEPAPPPPQSPSADRRAPEPG
ncbi:uncharacterized protein LOC115450265 [Manduca sexta]|uniref:Uncharacterized protein n=1 Tax=Manduca sexta TaxID=7130 RepID=A0A922CW72_MANSE|nr:uncharacterized protein LOC115450265 [Manduca sexta]KAG6460549.1 hypothetical protein O3G_MSEX012057 [Manduca sexta]